MPPLSARGFAFRAWSGPAAHTQDTRCRRKGRSLHEDRPFASGRICRTLLSAPLMYRHNQGSFLNIVWKGERFEMTLSKAFPADSRQEVSTHLRQCLWHGPALALMGEREGTWLAGQCWICAEGILRFLLRSWIVSPSQLELVTVGDHRHPTHHVVVHLRSGEQDWYLDANGVRTQEQLLTSWQQEEDLRQPFLAPANDPLLLTSGLVRDPWMSERLAHLLCEKWNPLRSSGQAVMADGSTDDEYDRRG
jgi:hypothetical protein